ncbi:MAG: diguanylate cyclase [bacterium]|nr:diguanylate cyclase [bacterium]
MKRILVVEDSQLFARMIVDRISEDLSMACDVAGTMAEAVQYITDFKEEYLVAVLDLHLPDSHEGEIVDYAVSHGVPSIVMTAQFNDEIRERVLKKRVLDYIVKEGRHSLKQLTYTIERLTKNSSIKVLVVDDSKFARNTICTLMEARKFKVLKASNGKKALEIFEKNNDIKLIITDYQMPELDGFQLIAAVRENYDKDQLVIIGVSSQSAGATSAKFLKKGANDFVLKPFVVEEFSWRINQNLEMLEYIEALREAAVKDYLTKLYNRRYFFDAGKNIFLKAQKVKLNMAIAMLDIDFFKAINDTYGHDKGDEALVLVSAILQHHFRSNAVVARFGGEEFCVICLDIVPNAALELFETLRREVENLKIDSDKGTISFTISIGLLTAPDNTLENAVNRADELLYQAKESGRNRIVSQ